MTLTKTSWLIKLFIKTLLLPVNVEEDGKVVCKIFSWRTVLHFLIIVGPTAVLFGVLMLLVPELSMINIDLHQSSFEIISKNINFIISNLSILFPILLGYGLNSLPLNALNTPNHCWPKGGWKNITGDIQDSLLV